jgi:cytoskeletal protein RodZ
MKKKTIMIAIVVIAVAIALSVGLLVPAFAQEPAEEQAVPEEITEEQAAAEKTPDIAATAPEEEVSAPEPPAGPGHVVRADMAAETVRYERDTVEYTYYDVASDGPKAVQAEVAEDSSLGFGLEVVSQQLFGKPLAESGINPNSISLEGGNLYIDFSAAIYDIQAGVEGEDAVLESIADAYLNNLPEVQAVYYTVDGGDYSSGHFSIPGGTPYKTK